MNTTHISIPYDRWWRGIYNAPFPVIIDRKAGWNPCVKYVTNRPGNNRYQWHHNVTPPDVTIHSMCGQICKHENDLTFQKTCNGCQRSCICR